MYGSFYMVCISNDDILKAVGTPMYHIKVEASTLLEVEDYAKDLTEQMGNDWTLRTIEKVYCYSAAEYEMMGAVDVKITKTIETLATENMKAICAKIGVERVEAVS
jgi:hypothetical protein